MGRNERERRAVISSDQCIVDEKHFYIRGCLDIPILGQEESWIWGLWALVSMEDFDVLDETWKTVGREKRLPPMKARLANALKVYPATLNLKMTLRVQPLGSRPLFFIDEREHEMAQQQIYGISREQAVEMACLLMHTG